MKYNIIAISDIHWGIVSAKEQLKSLEFIFEYIEETINTDLHPHLLVIIGDYFDSQLPLNSQEAINSIQWFHRLYNVCKDNHILLRLVQGTSSHDNDQLDAFKPLENNEFFKIILTTTVEETLPGLICCYCPDETLCISDYEKRYINEILTEKDIGFFHGSFDLVYGDLYDVVARDILDKKIPTVIYNYDLWSPGIKGPLIAGHWHNGENYKELYYCGSPFRWKFNEDEPKGFLTICYDTEDSSYMINKIINPLCAQYITYEVYSNLYTSKDDYTNIVMSIKEILKGFDQSSLNDKLKIVFYIVDDKVDNDVFPSALRQEIINQSNCKIIIKNKLKNKGKKYKTIEDKNDNKRYDFIYAGGNRNNSTDVIYKFIKEEIDYEIQIPREFIEERVKKYI